MDLLQNYKQIIQKLPIQDNFLKFQKNYSMNNNSYLMSNNHLSLHSQGSKYDHSQEIPNLYLLLILYHLLMIKSNLVKYLSMIQG